MAQARLGSDCVKTAALAAKRPWGGPHWVIRVAPTGSKASPNVRYAFNSDRICASQRTDAMCQDRKRRALFNYFVGL